MSENNVPDDMKKTIINTYRYYSRRNIVELEGYCGLGNVAFVPLERQQRFDRLADAM